MCPFRSSALPTTAALLISGLVASSSVTADVYKYVDSKGHIYLTDRPPHDGYRLVLKSDNKPAQPRVDYRNKDKNRQRFATRIAAVAQRHDLPEALIHAVVATESAYDPNAVSRAGAVGLMQLMPATARRYGVTNRRDPTANLSAGTRYLKDLLEHFNNDLELALAGFNAGENAVKKYGNKIPPFDETRSYVRKVLQIYQEYPGTPADDA